MGILKEEEWKWPLRYKCRVTSTSSALLSSSAHFHSSSFKIPIFFKPQIVGNLEAEGLMYGPDRTNNGNYLPALTILIILKSKSEPIGLHPPPSSPLLSGHLAMPLGQSRGSLLLIWASGVSSQPQQRLVPHWPRKNARLQQMSSNDPLLF
jgi:hypothetical protein